MAFIVSEHNTHYVVSDVHVAGLPVPDDAPFLEVAVAANLPLVTGNIDHFPSAACPSVSVQTPAQFMESWQERRTPEA